MKVSRAIQKIFNLEQALHRYSRYQIFHLRFLFLKKQVLQKFLSFYELKILIHSSILLSIILRLIPVLSAIYFTAFPNLPNIWLLFKIFLSQLHRQTIVLQLQKISPQNLITTLLIFWTYSMAQRQLFSTGGTSGGDNYFLQTISTVWLFHKLVNFVTGLQTSLKTSTYGFSKALNYRTLQMSQNLVI